MLGEKGPPWERPGAGRKLEVKRDAGGRAAGLGEELRRGSRPSMCGGKVQGCAAALLGKPINQHYTRHSQLAFVVLLPPHLFLLLLFERGKEHSGPVLFLDPVHFVSFIKWPDARRVVGYSKALLSDLNHGGENIIYAAHFIKK